MMYLRRMIELCHARTLVAWGNYWCCLSFTASKISIKNIIQIIQTIFVVYVCVWWWLLLSLWGPKTPGFELG